MTASASASECSTRRCIRSVMRVARALDAGQVDEDQLPVGAVATAAHLAAGGLGLVGDDRHLVAHDRVRLTSVDLPALGRPARATNPERFTGPSAARSPRRHDPLLKGEHLAGVGLVVHAAQVQHAVHDRLAQVLGVLGADHHVAELGRPAVDREGEDVGGLVADRCSRLSARIRPVDQRDGQVPVLDPARRQGRTAGARSSSGASRGRDRSGAGFRAAASSPPRSVLYSISLLLARLRSSGACFSAYSL